MLGIFSRLTSGEEMPAREKIRVRRRAVHSPRRARRRPRRGTSLRRAHQLYLRLGWQQAMLLVWAVVSAGLIAVALALNTSGHNACVRSVGTACPSPSIPRHADASHMMNVRLLAEAFPRGQSAGCAIVQLDPQARTIGNACPRANNGSGSPLGRLSAASAAQSHP